MGGEFRGDPPRECRRGSARVDRDREITRAPRRRHREVATIGIGRVADQHVRCASVGHDAGVGLGVVGCGDGQRGIVEVARRVGALGKRAPGGMNERAQGLADPLGNDKNRKAGRNERLGFTRGNAASADDYGSTTVRPQRNGEHTQSQRVPRPVGKNRLTCCARRSFQLQPARPWSARLPRPSPRCRGLAAARCGITAKRPMARSPARFC